MNCGTVKQLFRPFREQPTYHHVLTLGEGTGIGARTLLQQEGKIFDKEICTSQLTDEHISQLKAVCAGAWMNKFTTNGKGPVHSRFFWVDPTTMKIHWAKNIEARYIVNKDTNEDQLIGVRSSASNAILKRKDFDPVNRHKYAFTIFTKDKIIDVIALSSEDFKIWLNGLQLLINLGSDRAIAIINH
jgi:hypothetical protein